MTSSTTKSAEKNRIPESLAKQAIFQEFLSTYLDGFDEISGYNSKVLTKSDSEWNSYKIMDKAREMARPVNGGEVNDTVKDALEAYETLNTELNRAKQAVLQATAKELGIEFSAGSERDMDLEAALKEKRKTAINIGDQLTKIAEFTGNEQVKSDIKAFLDKYQMPAVGRNQTHSFSAEGSGTPKYRVKVTVSRDGEELFTEDGFTKTAQSLTKFYERGKAPKADKLRAVWENAGNTMDSQPQPRVEFIDNDLTFVITSKK